MKKTNLVKVVSILLVSLMVILFSTNVFAAENNDTSFQDLTGTLGNSTENNTSKNTNANNANKMEIIQIQTMQTQTQTKTIIQIIQAFTTIQIYQKQV